MRLVKRGDRRGAEERARALAARLGPRFRSTCGSSERTTRRRARAV